MFAGTPHPKKLLFLNMRKPLKRLLPPPSKLTTESHELLSTVESIFKTPQVNSGSQLNSAAAQPKVESHASSYPQPSTHVSRHLYIKKSLENLEAHLWAVGMICPIFPFSF